MPSETLQHPAKAFLRARAGLGGTWVIFETRNSIHGFQVTKGRWAKLKWLVLTFESNRGVRP